MAELVVLPILVLFPVAEIAMKLVDPLIDGAVELAFKGVEAYEKTKPPTYPVTSCAYGSSCKDRFLKCPCFHEYSDCADYIADKHSCDGKCQKYHRKFVGGRGLSSTIRPNRPITITRTQFVPTDVQVWGKISIGVKWDIIEDDLQFAAKRAVGDFSNVICKSGEWQDLNLSAGIFSLNGEFLQGIYYDDSANLFSNAADNHKTDFYQGAVHHKGNDKTGGSKGREKPGNHGFNEVIDIDFDKVPDHVGVIVVSLNAYSASSVPFLINSEIAIFMTPNEEGSTKPGPNIVSLKLEPKDELAVQPGYIFGKFVRSAIGWKFVPIRANHGMTSNTATVRQMMRQYVQETTSADIPVDTPDDACYIELDVLSFTKDRRFSIPIKQMGFICFDIFGRKMDGKPPFIILKQEDSGGLQLKYHRDHDKNLSSVFFYVDHGDVDTTITKGDVMFVVGKAGDPLLCGIGNLGASKQLVARIIDIEKTRWEITTYAIPLNNSKPADSAALDEIYARRLVPLVENKLKVLRDTFIPPSPVAHALSLVVEVLYGRNLAVKDLKSSDPFVVVRFESQKFKTEVVKNTTSPMWNAKFTLDIENLHADITVLNFRCKDWNKISKTASMGVAQFDLMDLNKKNYKEEIHLELQKDPKHPKQSFAGYITIRLYFSD